ncbi:MAG TPA: hypothetical protein HPP80_09005 [Rhodospirillaceae bacterium]|nr:hypothetical protein [Rhodospirillaceae bacterium]
MTDLAEMKTMAEMIQQVRVILAVVRQKAVVRGIDKGVELAKQADQLLLELLRLETH